MAFVPFFEFIKIPVIFHKTIGQTILEPKKSNRLGSIFLKIFYYILITNYNVQLVFQGVYFVEAIRASDATKAFSVAPVFGFGFIASFKQMTLHLNRAEVRRILKEMEEIFPLNIELQKDYNMKNYIRTLRNVMKIFAALCVFNTIYYSLYPLVESLTAVFVLKVNFDFPLGFPIWYPFDPLKSWLTYILTYTTQFFGGHLAGVAFLVADLVLVSSVTQLCMHFDYISRKLENFEPYTKSGNHKFLNEILLFHSKCLDLSYSVDRVFSFSLLLNFLSSSGNICLVGFQMVAGSTKELFRYSVLMLTSLSQVWVICVYGNKLIDTSRSIGDAAFSHNWFNCDIKYRKKILLMICRSQKIAAIHAPTFPPISLQTFNKVISMSYQFFAVLQTAYGRKYGS